jgi:hypothetical protein
MAVGVLEIEAPAAVIVIDLAAPGQAGIRPVHELTLMDAAEDCIEIVLADQERVML